MMIARPDWRGQTVVCVASGPSLTPADCELVRCAGLPTIVTNTTFRLCPWADVLYAMDSAWWDHYLSEVDGVFRGLKVSSARTEVHAGVQTTYACPWFIGHGNSGTSAIAFAVACQAERIVLLGYDCQKQGAKVHWHADHPEGMSNAKSMNLWPKQFKCVADYAKAHGCTVVNASRATALECFQRVSLEEALRIEALA